MSKISRAKMPKCKLKSVLKEKRGGEKMKKHQQGEKGEHRFISRRTRQSTAGRDHQRLFGEEPY